MVYGLAILALLSLLILLALFDRNKAKLAKEERFLARLRDAKIHYMANSEGWEELPLKDSEVEK